MRLDQLSELEPELSAMLHELRHTSLRDPRRVSAARARFLMEVGTLTPRVSDGHPVRLNVWQEILAAARSVRRKERSTMFNAVVTVVVAIGVLFGGGATTVAAAQTALPDEPLYAVKMWSEQVRQGWESDPEAKFGLALEFNARRAEEVRTMLAEGAPITESLMTRLQAQQRTVLSLAAGAPEHLALPELQRAREQARLQDQAMERLQLRNQNEISTCTRVRAMIQEQERAAARGIEDPNWLREQLRLGWGAEPESGSPSQTSAGSTGSDTSGGGNPWAIGTPTPGSSYGPGTSQNPWTDMTPTPGSAYGPGPGSGDCGCDGEGNQTGGQEPPAGGGGTDGGSAGGFGGGSGTGTGGGSGGTSGGGQGGTGGGADGGGSGEGGNGP